MLSTVLLTLCLLISYNTNKVAGLTCPKVEPAHNFDPVKTHGSWYIVTEHMNTYTSHLDCLHCNFTITGKDTRGYYEGIKKETGEHVRYEVMSTLIADGTFQVDHVENHVKQDLIVYILYADYDDCSLHYTCSEELNLLYTWTLCRSPSPSEASITKAHQTMDKYQLPYDDLDKVNQNDCPEY